MKKIVILLAFFINAFLSSIGLYAQGATCASADPFCAGSGSTFAASTGSGTAAAGPNYGCLTTQPNPVWYYLNILAPGPHSIFISSTAGVDVDMAVWGPVPAGSSMASVCATLSMGTMAPVSCSYSFISSGTMNFTSTAPGQIYVLLITNFSNAPTGVTVNQTGGTGTTDCAIISPSVTIACPAAATIPLNASCQATLPSYIASATVTPASGVTVTQSPAAGTLVSGTGVTLVTLTATNGVTSASCSFNVTRVDNTAPTITCPVTQILALGAACSATLPDYRALATKSDNCTATGAITVTQSPAIGSTVSAVGTTVVTLTATDAAGNTASCSFNVNRVDTTPPSITCPANISVNNTVNTCGAAVTCTAPVGTDNCAGASTTQIAGLPSGATFPVGVTTNTFRVTDAVGLTTTCSFTVTVVDNQAPTITCSVNISVNNTVNTCGAAVTYTAPVGTDNCAGATTAQIAGLASGATFPVGTTTNTFRVTDAAGLTATCSFTVTVTDNQAPSITCPANISVNNTVNTCGAAVTYTAPVGTDNCAGATTAQIAGLASGATFPVGTTTNTFRVTDAAGLTATCSFTVTVTDNQAPSITCPANISVNNTVNTCGAAVTYTAPVGTDNCAGATTAQIAGLASGATFPVGTTTNTFRVTDAAGLTATCSFTVTVTDNQAPSITCPANISVNNTVNTCGAAVTYTAPVGTDNCTGATTAQIAGLASGATFPVGTTTNTFRVTDAAGLTATCSFTVTVVDNQAPSITCPANISVNNTVNTCGAAVTYTAPVGTDNCTGATTTQIAGLASGATFPVGTTTNTFRVTDAAGLTTTCSFNVTVVDNQAPSITCPANISVNNTVNTCGAAVTYTAPVGTDNCTGATTTQIAGLASGATFPVGTTTNTFRVTDASGNTATCSFTVTVIDNQAPTITCPANMIVLSTGTSAVVTLPTPVTTDNCGVASVVLTPASGSTFPLGVNTVNAVVTDVNGNTASCSFTVTVVPTSPPPSAPSYLIVEGQDTKILKLRFNDTEINEDGYEIFRSIDGVTWNFHVLTAPWTVGGEVVYYDSINTVADERYFYIVRTKRGSKRSGFTNSAYDYTYPNIPTVSVLQAACANGEGKIKAIGTHIGNKYRWYASAAVTEPFKNGLGDSYEEDVFTTTKLSANTTYFVTAKGKKYESKPRVSVVVPVITRPGINVVGGLAQRACGSEITLAVEPIAGTTFLWTLNGVTILGASGNTFTASQNGLYQVLVNNGSCVTGSNLISVAVNYKPLAYIKQGKAITFCQSGLLSAKEESTAAYQWYKDGVYLASGAEYLATSSGVYTLKAIESGCENTDEINVTVNSFPAIISLTADNETLCQGATTVLTTDNLVGASYNWYRNNKLFSTTTTPNLTVKKGGEYTVEPIFNDCGKRSSSVYVNEVRKVVLTQDFDGLTLVVNVPSTATVSSATWTIDGEPAPSLNNLLSFKPTKNGIYELTVVFNNSCESKMKTSIYLSTLGTDEEVENTNFNLRVYPNPTKNHVFVSFGKAPKGEVSVVMTDNLGRSVINKTENLASEKLDINITTLPVGLYVLKLNFDGIEKTFKIIKE